MDAAYIQTCFLFTAILCTLTYCRCLRIRTGKFSPRQSDLFLSEIPVLGDCSCGGGRGIFAPLRRGDANAKVCARETDLD